MGNGDALVSMPTNRGGSAVEISFLNNLIVEHDTLIITVFASGDGYETPAFAFIVERFDSGVRKRLSWGRGSATGHRDHNRALVQALAGAILCCPRNTRVQVETTSKGFLVPSLNCYRLKWNAQNKWPKKTATEWMRFEGALKDQGVTFAEARYIESSPSLTFAQEQTGKERTKMRGARDRLAKFSEY